VPEERDLPEVPRDSTTGAAALPETEFVRHLREVGGKREIEVLDIMGSLSHKVEILANIDPKFQESEVGEVQYQVIQLEMDGKGIDLVRLTERCEELERIGKVVQAQLSYNVMQNAEGFVDGMQNIYRTE
jgi:hypothetical protein